ncbi:hypothetical protein C0389_05645 [bacterium]|nr:hypothetical protein [bacterium]
MSQKGRTYFLILFFLISTGMLFSKSDLDSRSVSKAGSILQPVSGEILLDFSIDEATDTPNNLRIIAKYQSTPIEIISNYSQKNYILSKRHFLDRADASRTNFWFTSLIRN